MTPRRKSSLAASSSSRRWFWAPTRAYSWALRIAAAISIANSSNRSWSARSQRARGRQVPHDDALHLAGRGQLGAERDRLARHGRLPRDLSRVDEQDLAVGHPERRPRCGRRPPRQRLGMLAEADRLERLDDAPQLAVRVARGPAPAGRGSRRAGSARRRRAGRGWPSDRRPRPAPRTGRSRGGEPSGRRRGMPRAAPRTRPRRRSRGSAPARRSRSGRVWPLTIRSTTTPKPRTGSRPAVRSARVRRVRYEVRPGRYGRGSGRGAPLTTGRAPARDQPVADPPDGEQVDGPVRVHLHLLAQAAHRHPDVARVRILGVRPAAREERLGGHRLAEVGRERIEQARLRRRERHRRGRRRRLAAVQLQRQVRSELQALARHAVAEPAQHAR